MKFTLLSLFQNRSRRREEAPFSLTFELPDVGGYGLLKSTLLTLLLAVGTSLSLLAADAVPSPNTLTEAQKAAGWKLLFDGKTTVGWRNLKKPVITTTNAWVVEDGWLRKVAKVRGGDIITTGQYTDFELEWEWRIPPKANNGMKYFILEERGGIGHEYQMIDDTVVRSPKQMTGSFYDVLPPKPHQPVQFAPDSNHSRVLVQGHHVEHWLNGERILDYELGSEDVLAAVAKSKFKSTKGFGTKVTGHILFTDHTDEAALRNIRIRELPAK
ncbi:MAG: DUF1080 domain-containing protein [Verrucomicrobia bacterium]|nr:DUF1080 domain-containing protein [Verrucomicrobiota bacterium]